MKRRGVFEILLSAGAVVAVAGGVAIGTTRIVEPGFPSLPDFERSYMTVMLGFAFLSLFAVAAVLIGFLRDRSAPGEASVPAPGPARKKTGPGLEGLYHEMKTYIDLEMWELALEKANAILKNHPATREAELVSRNVAELRWKAEPKYVTQEQPLSAEQEKQLREKGLAQMYQHVRTYMDLDMWELARQKAITIMQNFPESPEAIELMKSFATIEKKAREAAPAAEKIGE